MQDGIIDFDSEINSFLGQKVADFMRINPKTDQSSVEFKKQLYEWGREGQKSIRRSVYQETLEDLASISVPSVSKRQVDAAGNPATTYLKDGEQVIEDTDTDTFGAFTADVGSQAHEYAVIRQNLYESGKKMPTWDEWSKSAPSKKEAMLNGLLIDSALAFEGSAKAVGQWIGGLATDLTLSDSDVARQIGVDPERLKSIILKKRVNDGEDVGTIAAIVGGGKMTDEEESIYNRYYDYKGEVLEQMREDQGNAWARGARGVEEAVGFLTPSLAAARNVALGSDAAKPQDIRERIGRAGGGFAVKAAEMTGSALGVLPYSVPAMLSRNPRVAAALTLPFYAMGHSDAWNRRMEIYKDQLAHAKANGLPEPARPSFAVMAQQARLAGMIEFGSEFTIDRLQQRLPDLLNWGGRKVGGRLGSGVAKYINDASDRMLRSLSRSQGVIGYAKAPLVAALGGITEGIEEAIPELGKEISDPLYIPEGYENDFFSSTTAEAIGTGFIAGMLTTGGSVASRNLPYVGKKARMRRLAKKNAAMAAGAIVDKAERLAVQRVVENAPQARGATMALYQVDEIAAGERMAMLVDADSADVTLPDDVKQSMEDNGISPKPLGMFAGMRVYGHVDRAQDIRDAIARGDASFLTGNGALKDPELPAVGAFVVRNKGNQVLDVIPYSSTKDAEAHHPKLQHRAALNGTTVEAIGADQLATLSETVELQVDADATMRKLQPPSKRGAAPRAEARGILALRSEVMGPALGSKMAGTPSQPFRSNYLSAGEIGSASNRDVEVDVVLRKVEDSQKSADERKLAASTGSNPTLLDGSVKFKIKRPDGSVDVIEKPVAAQGAYLYQSNPDGLFLIRENGNAFTAANAIAVLLHELRHRYASKSRGAAEYLSQLLYLDPELAISGGIQYMRDYATESTVEVDSSGNIHRLSEAEILGRYSAMQMAAQSILSDTESLRQAKEVMRQGKPKADELAAARETMSLRSQAEADRATVERFAEESLATAFEQSAGETLKAAIDYETVFKNRQEMSASKFASWAGYHLTRNGWAGPYARQALFELSQRRQGVDEKQLQVFQQMQSELAEQYRNDMQTHAERKAGSTSVGSAAVGALGSAIGSTVSAIAGGGDDEEVKQASSALADYEALPEEQKSSLPPVVSSVVSALSALAAASANVGGVRTATGRAIPDSQRKAPKVTFSPQGAEQVAEQPRDLQGMPEATEAPLTPMQREAMASESRSGRAMFSMRPDRRVEFFSALNKAIMDTPEESMTPKAWSERIRSMVNKGQVKQTEVDWTGLEDYLALPREEKKLSRESVARIAQDFKLDIFDATPNAMTTDDVKADVATVVQRWEEELTVELARKENIPLEDFDLPMEIRRDIKAVYDGKLVRGDAENNPYWYINPDAEARLDDLAWDFGIPLIGGQINESIDFQTENYADSAPTYEAYTLPGGENYRQAVIAVPNELISENPDETSYESSHWPEIPNPIAHIRTKDRESADGKKVLFVEELQSDWAKAGEKRGFRTEELPSLPEGTKYFSPADLKRNEAAVQIPEDARLPGAESIWYGRTIEQATERAQQALAARQIAVAPFVKSTDGWLNLTIKNVILDAVNGGYDRVAFVNGKQSADRYNLANKIRGIEYTKRSDGYDVMVWRNEGSGYERLNLPERIDEQSLADYFGEELAKKMIAGEGTPYRGREETKSLESADLEVGGRGMKEFYDKIVPAAVNKLLKKLGGGKATIIDAGTEAQQIGFDVTDAMRSAIVDAGGMAMFSMRRPSAATRVDEIAKDEIAQSEAMFSMRKAGTIQIKVIRTASLESAQKIASSKKWDRNRDLKAALQKAVLDAAAKEGINVKPMLSSYVAVAETDGTDAAKRNYKAGDRILVSRSAKRTVLASDPAVIERFEQDDAIVRKYLVKVGVKDSLAALSQNKTAKGWYDIKTRIALGVMALIHPEIVTDQNARFAFIYALAVTSNGLRVMQNFQLADKVYREYKATGAMPTNVGVGTSSDAMNNSLEKFNKLAGAWGLTNFRKMMMTEMTASEVSGLDRDLDVGGEWADTTVRGAAFLGPKIGNGFFANLNGMFDALTMDRWLIRTWGRWSGTLISEMPEQTERARRRMADAVSALTPEQKAQFEAVIGEPISEDADQAAERIANRLTDKKRRDQIPQDPAMQEVRKAANSLRKYLEGSKEAPSGPAERNMIREVFADILGEIQRNPEYADLTMADLQAVLWYAEKRLYENSKETQAEKDDQDYNDLEAPDYANAAIAVAKDAKISPEKIRKVEETENGRTGNARPGNIGQAAGSAGSVQQIVAREFAAKELSEFRGWVAANSVREERAADPGPQWNYGRVSGDSGRSRVLTALKISYIDIWKPGGSMRRAYARNGISAPDFYELEQTRANATKFRASISRSKKRSKFGAAVFVYEGSDYAKTRMFLSKDGLSGFAIKPDGDIVSVFSDKSVKHGRAALELAVAAGGLKLDCFDTILPKFYHAHGFEVAKRLSWDDSQAPAGWDKATFSKFNSGEPDVVFMAHDPKARPWAKFDPRAFDRTTDYSDAIAAQDKAIARFAKKADEASSGPMDAQFSMRRGARGIQDEAFLRYIDKYDELLRYQRIAAETGYMPTGLGNPYTGARLLQDRLGAMQRASERRYANLLRRMFLAGVTVAEMDRFLTAQHARERNAYIATINPAFPDGGSGMTTADAANYIATTVNSGRFGVMNGFADEWRGMLRQALNDRLTEGLITQETYDNLNRRYQNYVPLRGAPAQVNDEDFAAWGEPGGSGLSTTGRGVPRALGRQSAAEGVTSQVGYVHEDTFRRIGRNQIGRSFLNLVLAVNDVNMAQVIRPRRRVLVGGQVRNVHDMGWMSDPRNFGLYLNEPQRINGQDYDAGDLVVIRINNRRLADAMTTPTIELRAFERALGEVNNVWRFFTTGMGNPAFAPVNMIRDVGTAVIGNTARRGFVDTYQMMRRYRRAFMRVWADNWINNQPTGSYADFVNAGGDMTGWRGNDLEAKRTDFNDLAERVERRDPNDRTLARTLLGWYSGFFAASETAARLAQYEQRIATGSTPADAALAARDLTVDFRKGGLAKPVLNTWYMFLNAGLQGTVNVAESIARAAAVAPSLFMLGFAQAMISRLNGGDDDETQESNYDAIPDYEKTSNMYFFNPTGSGGYFKVPVPYGYNVFFSAGVRLEALVNGSSTPSEMFSGMLVDALNAFNPIGGSGITGGTGNVLSSVLPTMVRPIAEVAINEDFAGRPIYPKQYGKYPSPDSAIGFDGSPEAYISTAEWLNQATGGDQFQPGMVDVSPNTMEYLVGYYFSGTGRLMNRLYKATLSNDEVTVNDIPVIRSFIGSAAEDNRAVSQRYNAIANELAPTLRRIDVLKSEDSPADMKAAAAASIEPGKVPLAETLKATDKALSDLRGLLRNADGESRKELLEARRRVQKALIRRKNELTARESAVD